METRSLGLDRVHNCQQRGDVHFRISTVCSSREAVEFLDTGQLLVTNGSNSDQHLARK
jgi:hypothetical protein